MVMVLQTSVPNIKKPDMDGTTKKSKSLILSPRELGTEIVPMDLQEEPLA